MVAMSEPTVTVDVRAEQEGGLWVLRINGDAGVTQTVSLNDVRAVVTDYVALMWNVPAETVRVRLRTVVTGQLRDRRALHCDPSETT